MLVKNICHKVVLLDEWDQLFLTTCEAMHLTVRRVEPPSIV
jgi:hypothetical protein